MSYCNVQSEQQATPRPPCTRAPEKTTYLGRVGRVTGFPFHAAARSPQSKLLPRPRKITVRVTRAILAAAFLKLDAFQPTSTARRHGGGIAKSLG